MIDPPKRARYRLTYDAQMYYDDWKEHGGCRCFQGNAPCSSCTHEGHPISLEENDEAWELDNEEVEMSRQSVTDVGESKIGVYESFFQDDYLKDKRVDIPVTLIKPNDSSITKEDVNMSTTQRKVVEVQLFDDAKGLPVQDSLVAKFDNVLTEDDNDTTIREVIMNNDLKAVLKAHNAKRAKVTNLDILERTGNSVPLQPVLLKDLRWKVIG